MKIYLSDFVKQTMRISSIILLVVTFSLKMLAAREANAQLLEKQVSVKFQYDNLLTAIQRLEKLGVRFAYDEDLLSLKSSRAINQSFNLVPLEQVLKSLFGGTAITYEEQSDFVVLRKRQPAGRITGHITDEQGQVLPGASIRVEERNLSTSTNEKGDFTIAVPGGTYTLNVTYISFKSQRKANIRVNAGQNTTVNFVLQSDEGALKEVVVVGYGTAKRSDLTGAVSTVKMADLQNVPVTRVDQMLAGRIAGAEFVSTDGEPGSGTSVRIRGTRSINASNEPLYVVDGVMDGINSLNELNPSDIASISVLKDASSTAIYGSRGSNGVIIITTKAGVDKGGKTDFTVKTNQGYSELPRLPKVMNATEFAQLMNDRFYHSTTANRTAPLEDYPYPDPLSMGEGTDWTDEVTRRAVFSNYSLSAGGGNKNTRYYFSGNYDNNEGIILNSGMKRYQARLNFDQTLSKNVKGGLRVNYSNIQRELNKADIGSFALWYRSTLMLAPVVPAYKPDGTLNDWNSQWYSGTQFDSPLANVLLRKNSRNEGSLGSMMYLEVKPIEDILVRSSVSYSNYLQNNDALTPSTMPTRITANSGAAASQNENRNTNILNENTVTYKHTFGGNHNVSALYGFTIQKQSFKAFAVSGSGYFVDAIGSNDLGSIPNKQNLNVSSSAAEQTRLSHLGRLNYDYAGKYYLTATLRRDGASNFAAGNKWAYFPSAGFRWNVLKENFMKGSSIDEFAIRLSAGTSGNDAIARYASLDRLSSTTGGYLFGGAQPVAYYPSQIANQGLKWEKTTMYNAGADLSFFKNRLNVTLEAYKSKTSDLLLSVQLPTQTGYASRLTNIGKTSNKGLELSINYEIIRSSNFTWSSALTMAHNKQMVNDIGGLSRVTTFTYNYGAQYMINGYQAGFPLNAIYGMQYAGVWQNQAEIDQGKIDKKYVSASAAYYSPGRQRYVDQNNDGILNNDDLVYLGNADPDIYGGFQNTFRYKKAFLSVFFNYSIGGELYNPLEMFMGTGVYLNNQFHYMVDRWHATRNPDSDLPRADSKDDIPNDRFVHDATFIRLKAASAGYVFDLSRLTDQRLQSLALSVSGNNLMLWKYYTGFDPEVSTQGGGSTVRRFDNGAYPPSRTISFSAEIKF